MRKKKLKIFLAVFLVCALACAIAMAINFESAADKYAEYEIKNTLIQGINNIYYNQTRLNYENLKGAVEISRNSGGKITSISVDSVFLNLFTSETVTRVILFLESSSSSFGLPLGNLTSVKLLSGLGPKIKLKVVLQGNVAGGITSSFHEAGINQTLHRLTFEIKALVSAMTPFGSHETEINVSFIISETVIVGDIPNVYFK